MNIEDIEKMIAFNILFLKENPLRKDRVNRRSFERHTLVLEYFKYKLKEINEKDLHDSRSGD